MAVSHYSRDYILCGKLPMSCIGLLLTAQMLFALASEHNEAGRYISEQMEVQRASWYMKQYRSCK